MIPSSNTTLFLILVSFVAYLVATEEHFLHFTLLIFKSIKISFERLYWMIKLHPILNNNFIARWFLYRKYLKIAEELEKEINDKL